MVLAMREAWTTWLRRLNVASIVLLLPTGAVGFSALIAGPKNTDVVTVLPPRYSVTDFPMAETHTAWLALVVALAWLLALARAPGPWGDSGRCVLLLAFATGHGSAPSPSGLSATPRSSSAVAWPSSARSSR